MAKLEDLKGEVVDEIGTSFIRFRSGRMLSWCLEGDVGMDGGWYQFLRVYVDGARAASL